MTDEKKQICSFCESEIKADDDFCPNCGSLFIENVKCSEHPEEAAAGVCIICCEPYCADCGLFVHDKIFLCNYHSEYEIVEGMAKVLGNNDYTQIDFAKANLEAEGLHPFIFSRKTHPLFFTGSDYSAFGTSGGYDRQMIDELKVMVPVQEVIRAEEILRDLKLLEEE
jgi:hypothetical protein